MVRPPPINSVVQEAKGGFTVRSVPWQESGRILSVLGPGEASTRVDPGLEGGRGIEGS